MQPPPPPAARNPLPPINNNGAATQLKGKEHDGFEIIATENQKKSSRSAFLCNIKFENSLPEIPCDPKMLLPPLNPQELAAFSLTSLEKEIKRDMLFPNDLGIPINALDIERYSIPQGAGAQMHPADAALLQDSKDGTGASALPDVTWLMRTKQITNDGGQQGGISRPASQGQTRRDEESQQEDGVDLRAKQIAAIEASFEAIQLPLKHPKNPNAAPVSILPILPDTMLEDWVLVHAVFDGNPVADVDRLNKLSADELSRVVQAAQLKSFSRELRNGKKDSFVAFLLPNKVPQPAQGEETHGGAVALPAKEFCGDYEWVREYDSKVQTDRWNRTYLFREDKAAEYVGYSDLNMSVELKKRKKNAMGRAGDDDDDAFVQPEKLVIGMAGAEDNQEQEEEGRVEIAAAAVQGHDEGEAMEVDDDQSGEEKQNAMTAAMMRDAFGSDDDDD